MNYSRIVKSRRRKQIITSLFSLTLVSSIIALVFVFSTTNVNTESVATKENTISSSKELKNRFILYLLQLNQVPLSSKVPLHQKQPKCLLMR